MITLLHKSDGVFVMVYRDNKFYPKKVYTQKIRNQKKKKALFTSHVSKKGQFG